VLCERALCFIAAHQRAEAARAWQQGAGILRDMCEFERLEQLTAAMREACAKAGVPPFDEE
jgi:hypothetical protein